VDLEALLAPIRPEQPAGENLRESTGTLFGDLRKLASSQSAEDDVFEGKGREADWPAVLRTAGDALATRSKDLELAGYLALAELQLHGLPGLAEGLGLVGALIERYWDSLHPGLEDGALDLEFRAKPVAWLDAALAAAPSSAPGGSIGKLRTFPLVPRPGGGTGLSWIDRALAGDVDKYAKDQPNRYQEMIEAGRVSTETWTAAVAGADRGALQTLVDQLVALEQQVGELRRLCVERFGERDAPTLIQTTDLLADIRGYFAARIGGDAAAAEAGAEAGVAGATAGPLGSRAAAVAKLGEVAEWFRRAEPHSPVSYLIERAVRWANMPFDELVRDYIKDPNVQGQIWETLGIKREG
jgi:type VI secretion system protein ImpA